MMKEETGGRFFPTSFYISFFVLNANHFNIIAIHFFFSKMVDTLGK